MTEEKNIVELSTRKPMRRRQGIVAILDALGAANYSEEQIDDFIRARKLLLNDILSRPMEKKLKNPDKHFHRFTFGDTLLLAYETEQIPTLEEVEGFAELLRVFIVDSLAYGKKGILWRGAFGIGSFFLNKGERAVLGESVGDAAAWYDRADWVGVVATPHASIYIRSLLARDGYQNFERLMLDYEVPFKDGQCLKLKAINWPKVFNVRGIRPSRGDARAECLSLLAQHGVPRGTESKYYNTIEFFEQSLRGRANSSEQ